MIPNNGGMWQARESSYVPTPLSLHSNLQWVSEKGMVIVMDCKSGDLVTRRRLNGLASGGRAIYASPVLSGKHIYVVTRRNGTYVFEANSEMKRVAVNEPLDDSDFNATPAVSDGRLILRSNTTLYCIQ